MRVTIHVKMHDLWSFHRDTDTESESRTQSQWEKTSCDAWVCAQLQPYQLISDKTKHKTNNQKQKRTRKVEGSPSLP